MPELDHSSAAGPMLRAERFGYSYPDAGSQALTELSLFFDPGCFCVVCGESGSGKSSLLRAVCGLVPHFHGGDATGELEVAGLSVRDHGPADLGAVCGTLLQDPETQVVMSGVRAEIALALEHRGESPAAVARGVEEIALALGIGSLLERRVDTLSGGELQRVALAAALAPRPRLLVLDEPTAQLDPIAGAELISLLRRLNEEWGTTILIAEHRLERCLPAADRVLALRDGRIACDAAPADFLAWAAAHAETLLPPLARLFALAGLRPLPVSVRDARGALATARTLGLCVEGSPSPNGPKLRADSDQRREEAAPTALADRSAARPEPDPSARTRLARALRPRRALPPPALSLRGVWHELADGPAILRGVDLRLDAGERVALMGRNGAGKSTLLRHARGLLEPTRGTIERSGDVALLLQNPGDYLLAEHVGDEAGPAAVAAAGLAGLERRHPRDLSGGERQRLALEVALEAGGAVVCLDEPTRGMDADNRGALATRLDRLAEGGAAVLVATHDTAFAAAIAERVVLMGEGVVIADGPATEVLAGGWHYATDVTRALDGAAGALTPEDGARLLVGETATPPAPAGVR